MARPPLREKSKLSKAVIALRSSFGESQQDFSNRLGMALNTISRYETSRAPSGFPLLSFAEMADKQGLPELSFIFTQGFTEWMESEVGADGIDRLLKYYAESRQVA